MNRTLTFSTTVSGHKISPDIEQKPSDKDTSTKADSDVDQLDDSVDEDEPSNHQPLFFRCTGCRRPSHYLCLPPHEDQPEDDIDGIAKYWQIDWTCNDCNELEQFNVQYILAWRKPIPADRKAAIEDSSATQKPAGTLRDPPKAHQTKSVTNLPNIKDPFDEAEYLCKYEDLSFTDCTWVTHS